MLSFECHSPIISLTNGTPAFYLRQPEDTIKGQMYYDLGLSDWVFEIEEVDGSDIVMGLGSLIKDYNSALERVKRLNGTIENIYRSTASNIFK